MNLLLLRSRQKESDSTTDSSKGSQETGEEEKEEERDRDDESFVRFTGRTASGMIKDMFNPYTTSTPGKAIPSSPSANSISSASMSYCEGAHHSFSSWRVPKEMCEHQEGLMSTSGIFTSEEDEEGGIEEEEEDNPKLGDETSSVSSVSSESSKKSIPSNSSFSSTSTTASEEGALCKSENPQKNGILSHGVSMTAICSPRRTMKKVFGRKNSGKDEKSSPDRFLENFNPKNKTQKIADQGYFTFRRPNKKPKGKKPGHRFSMRPQKMVSVTAEISSPSGVVKTSISPSALSSDGDAASLMRHPAFRSKRGMRIGHSLSDTIPEASFTLEISTVPVVFKTTKMDVPCRGQWGGVSISLLSSPCS